MVILVIMGVCGSGKTTVAQGLAEKLQCSFRDADEFHSEENKKKMSSAIPLTDEDRLPWLLAIHTYIKELWDQKVTGIVTCSALKRKYRQILLCGELDQHSNMETSFKDDVLFVYLKGSLEVIMERLKARTGHFMPPALLQSQLETLEEPEKTENHMVIDIKLSIDDIIAKLMNYTQRTPLKHIPEI